ncbi:MAG: DUF2726 domain-containing protein [Rubrivivax sp.]|nr:DUF2726 domain-containing protein [Rubrivivax sp.]
MEFLPPFASFALPTTALLLLSLLYVRWMQRRNAGRSAARDALDTVGSWPPEAARVLTISERQAYDLLRRAMPGFLVLAQVPLSRFIRVPSRHSYTDWLQRVGSLSADLLFCDAGSRVLAVIDIRVAQESDRARRRHERMTRVLRKAGVHVLTWREDDLPTTAEVRHAMTAIVGGSAAAAAAAAATRANTSRPMPLIPVAEISEILADGDRAAFEAEDPSMEPVPSAFFEELEVAEARR